MTSRPISDPVTMDDCMITFDTPTASLRQATYGFSHFLRPPTMQPITPTGPQIPLIPHPLYTPTLAASFPTHSACCLQEPSTLTRAPLLSTVDNPLG